MRREMHLFVHEPTLSKRGEERHEDVTVDGSFRIGRSEGGKDSHAFADLRRRDEKRQSASVLLNSEGRGRRTLAGVLGMLRTTVQLAGTHSRIIEIVVPARMEMRSLPSSAADIPGPRRRRAASWGLQLFRSIRHS
jgi:hypothetical protein